MRSREELIPGEGKIEMFLSDLAINGKVAASTQNQAFNALLFLYREVLHQPFENIQAVRANRPVRVPAVLTPEEVKQVIVAMSGLPQLVVKLLYGSGLRLLEALRLRVQDLDFEMKQLTVRDGKGAKDRFTVLSESLIFPVFPVISRYRRACQKSFFHLEYQECRAGALGKNAGLRNMKNSYLLNRRDFVRTGLLGSITLSMANVSAAISGVSRTWERDPDHGLKLGLTTYTFKNFSLDQAIAMTKEAGVKYISLKDMHLPMKSSPDERRERSEEHTSELQSPYDLVCRLLLEKKN